MRWEDRSLTLVVEAGKLKKVGKAVKKAAIGTLIGGVAAMGAEKAITKKKADPPTIHKFRACPECEELGINKK